MANIVRETSKQFHFVRKHPNAIWFFSIQKQLIKCTHIFRIMSKWMMNVQWLCLPIVGILVWLNDTHCKLVVSTNMRAEEPTAGWVNFTFLPFRLQYFTKCLLAKKIARYPYRVLNGEWWCPRKRLHILAQTNAQTHAHKHKIYLLEVIRNRYESQCATSDH